ncbi:MAG: divergent PAP2 family protein [Treponema sp.]|nr:divergent PAP2 family protein [Treponema sp.]
MGAFREQFKNFLLNPVLLSCVCSWMCAQFIKTLIALAQHRVHRMTELCALLLWRTGGMPSSHSALVSSLCTTIAFRNGLASDLFVVSLCFFLVTVRDAFGVRRASGIQAKKLNDMGRRLDEKNLITYIPLKVVSGHTPIQVLVGIVLGFFIGCAFSLL